MDARFLLRERIHFFQAVRIPCVGVIAHLAQPDCLLRRFQFYNVSAQYTCANGTTSQWLGLPFDWQSLPSSWQGIAPTPAMTPDVVQAFYGLHPESYTTNVTQGVAGAWVALAWYRVGGLPFHWP